MLKEYPTITLKVNDRENAETVFDLYEKMVEGKFPKNEVDIPNTIGSREGWAKSLTFPVELYLVFPNKRTAGQYLRKIVRDPFIKAHITGHY